MSDDVYAQIAVRIITSQEAIVGPLAVEQAKQVHELKVDWRQHQVTITGNKMKAIEDLIDQYRDLFGHISVEVSKQAAGSLMSQLPADGLPASLR
jgi:nitric oxide reductase large subunit